MLTHKYIIALPYTSQLLNIGPDGWVRLICSQFWGLTLEISHDLDLQPSRSPMKSIAHAHLPINRHTTHAFMIIRFQDIQYNGSLVFIKIQNLLPWQQL